jgi:putative photosynthetic complex assembly protein 2
MVFPSVFTLLLWWFSTGLILYIDGLPRSTYKWTLSAAGVLWLLAMWQLHVSATDASVKGAYVAFCASLGVWAWHEMALLMGLITGPRRTACPPGASGWPRVKFAIEAVLYHEIALLLQFGLLALMLQDSPNRVGLCTFGILYVMRLSAKLNVFLGVRNLNEKWLPPNLKYLHSYFRQRAANSLFPLSVLFSTVLAVFSWQSALDPASDGFHAAADSFAATLFTLATLEHALMVVPLSADALWGWAWRSRARPAE